MYVFLKVLKRKQDTMYFYKHTLYVTIYTVRTSTLYIEYYIYAFVNMITNI